MSLRIGFFDSGIGGLSVLRHAPHRIPDASYVYVADSAFAPYGARSGQQVLERSLAIAHYLEAQEVDALVIACNTATAVAAERVRAEISLPVIAMEPAIKPAMQLSRNGRVVVLATESTLGSARYRSLKDSHALQGEVIERACHHWVEALEHGAADREQRYRLVAEELRDIRETGADTYILGCTHFPFLYDEIREVLDEDEYIVDPAPAVIEQLARRLDVPPYRAEQPASPELALFSSGDCRQVGERIHRLLGWDVQVQSLQL